MPPESESDYYPYGGEIVVSSPTIQDQNYKFTGKERDSQSGLDNFGARYDSSALGRFMTPDWAVKPTTVPYAVFGDPQSLNLYGYVRNDPISRVDPDGHYEVNASGCNGNNQAKCQKKYDKATQRFEQARQKDLKSKDANVRAAATAYGAPGTKNGVHVGFESNRQMSAEYGSPIDGRVVAPRASNGKLKPIDLEVTISTDLRGKSLRREIAHEGSHVGDDIAFFTSYNFATGNFDANKNITHGQSEDEAFSVGAGLQKNFGFGPDDAVAIDRFVRGHYENYNVKLFPENFRRIAQITRSSSALVILLVVLLVGTVRSWCQSESISRAGDQSRTLFCEIVTRPEAYDGRIVSTEAILLPTPHSTHLLREECLSSKTEDRSAEIELKEVSAAQSQRQKTLLRELKSILKPASSRKPACAAVAFTARFTTAGSSEARFVFYIRDLVSVAPCTCPKLNIRD